MRKVMDNLIGLTLENARNDLSCEVCPVESAPPIRPQNNRPARKKAKSIPSEIKVPRVQLWGEMRVLRVRELRVREIVEESAKENRVAQENASVEDDAATGKTSILEITIAREEAFSPSFAAALLS